MCVWNGFHLCARFNTTTPTPTLPARFRSSSDNSKALTAADLPDVAKLAHDAHDFMERTETAFGARSEWSPELAV